MDKFFTTEHGYFNWQSIVAIVGILGFLWGIYVYTDKLKSKQKEQKIQSQVQKQEKLTEPYNELIRIISLFPNKTPYDVMTNLPFPPVFNREDFDTVNRILEIQIQEDFKKRLERENLNYQDEEDIKTEIRNREYCIREIEKIKNQYFLAKKEYEQFRSNVKIIELYASQNVKNCLAKFDVTWHNAFIAGRPLEYNDGRNNKLDDIRWKLEQAVRADLGII
ncbi:hypothetical protein [uncultured Streptococcus sp.]|uniref:hypothetical protein n=1 Tax=uncultured Streptococcus sp. TaxID=83427 RepID=UPI0028D4D133|nr:hypothetical protein [uncultured Streptococcus sp.]